jgi:hypothetical protein
MSADRAFWVAPMRREIEEGEGVLFKEKFFNWSSTLPIQMQQIASGKNVAGSFPSFPACIGSMPHLSVRVRWCVRVRAVVCACVCGLTATKEQEKIDVLQLHRQPVLAEEIMVDDGHSKFPLSVHIHSCTTDTRRVQRLITQMPHPCVCRVCVAGVSCRRAQEGGCGRQRLWPLLRRRTHTRHSPPRVLTHRHYCSD